MFFFFFNAATTTKPPPCHMRAHRVRESHRAISLCLVHPDLSWRGHEQDIIISGLATQWSGNSLRHEHIMDTILSMHLFILRCGLGDVSYNMKTSLSFKNLPTSRVPAEQPTARPSLSGIKKATLSPVHLYPRTRQGKC